MTNGKDSSSPHLLPRPREATPVRSSIIVIVVLGVPTGTPFVASPFGIAENTPPAQVEELMVLRHGDQAPRCDRESLALRDERPLEFPGSEVSQDNGIPPIYSQQNKKSGRDTHDAVLGAVQPIFHG